MPTRKISRSKSAFVRLLLAIKITHVTVISNLFGKMKESVRKQMSVSIYRYKLFQKLGLKKICYSSNSTAAFFYREILLAYDALDVHVYVDNQLF